MSEARSSRGRVEVQRRPLSGLGRLMAAALVIFALCFIYEQVIMSQALVPPLAVFAVLSLVVASVVARGWRWAPLAGATWFALVFLVSLPIIISELINPFSLQHFVWQLVTTAVAIIGFVVGIAATVRNYSRGE